MLARLQTLRNLFPVTWPGLLLLGLSLYFGYFLGVLQTDWLFLTIGGFGALLCLLSFVYVGVLGLWVRSRVLKLNASLAHEPLSLMRGDTVKTGFRLPRTTFPFTDFSIRWHRVDCTLSLVRDVESYTEEMRFSHRQVLGHIERHFELTDLFGLSSVRWVMDETRQIEVLPRAQFHTPPMFQSRIDGEGSFVPNRPRHGDMVDTRPYLPGDPVRSIHWKLFARTGKPVVRVAEPSAREEKRLLLYMICGPDDEYAAELTLGALQSGEMGGTWEMGVDGVDRVASDLSEARRLLALSGNLRTHDPGGLERFLDQVSFSPEEHRLLLFAPGHMELWMAGLSGPLEHVSPYSSLVVACENQILPQFLEEKTRTKTERWFIVPSSVPTAIPRAEPHQLETLTHFGMQLTILERPSR
jgi:hypothetical protein